MPPSAAPDSPGSGLTVGATAGQLGGTASAPIAAPRPRAADTAPALPNSPTPAAGAATALPIPSCGRCRIPGGLRSRTGSPGGLRSRTATSEPDEIRHSAQKVAGHVETGGKHRIEAVVIQEGAQRGSVGSGEEIQDSRRGGEVRSSQSEPVHDAVETRSGSGRRRRRGEPLQRSGDRSHQLRQRRRCSRAGCLTESGGRRRRGERRQCRCGCRRSGVAVHRRGVLGPHLGVVSFGRRDRRGVLAEDVGGDQ